MPKGAPRQHGRAADHAEKFAPPRVFDPLIGIDAIITLLRSASGFGQGEGGVKAIRFGAEADRRLEQERSRDRRALVFQMQPPWRRVERLPAVTLMQHYVEIRNAPKGGHDQASIAPNFSIASRS